MEDTKRLLTRTGESTASGRSAGHTARFNLSIPKPLPVASGNGTLVKTCECSHPPTLCSTFGDVLQMCLWLRTVFLRQRFMHGSPRMTALRWVLPVRLRTVAHLTAEMLLQDRVHLE